MNASHLIERATRAHTHAGYTGHAALCTTYEAVIRDLCAQFNERTGVGLEPAPGWKLDFLPLGQTSVPVEYDIDEGAVTFGRVFTNGYWDEAAAVVPKAVLDTWVGLYEAAAEERKSPAWKRAARAGVTA